MKGIFLTMEGPDGSGKTTQILKLKEHLMQHGYDEVVVTREPGGTVISEAVRGILLNREYAEMDDHTEALLYAAARAQLVAQVIKPALDAGKAVISDRFVDSSAVYQGMARGLGVEKIYELNGFAMQGIWPDLTIHLDLPAEVGLARAKSRAELDRMEAQSTAFHEKVAQGYRDLAALAPERIVTIDATQDIDTIHAAIVDKVENCLREVSCNKDTERRRVRGQQCEDQSITAIDADGSPQEPEGDGRRVQVYSHPQHR